MQDDYLDFDEDAVGEQEEKRNGDHVSKQENVKKGYVFKTIKHFWESKLKI
jgi:hypothetical protein